MCMLSNDIHDYYIVSQGKTTIPNVDDGEECTLTDVSQVLWELRICPIVAKLPVLAFWLDRFVYNQSGSQFYLT